MSLDPETCIKTLVSSGDIPADSEAVSTNNKIVTVSRREKIVARIGYLAEMNFQDNPHDVGYSHKIAWLVSNLAPTVKPINEKPVVSSDYIISSYPMLRADINLETTKAREIYEMTRSFGAALPTVRANMELRRLDIANYVQDRLDHMRDDRKYNQRSVEHMDKMAAHINTQYPFDELLRQDPALIHGDFKASNIVIDDDDTLRAIDLDTVVSGPRLYDLASWRLRAELGDNAPMKEVIEVGRQARDWDEESYCALVSWKAISTLSFTLRYGVRDAYEKRLPVIAEATTRLGGLALQHGQVG